MPLREPPSRSVLWKLPRISLGDVLWRCHRSDREMWWFASTSERGRGGRFDLARPNGTCYTATSRAASVVEAFQDHFGPGSLITSAVLSRRCMSSVTVPEGAPKAANLTDRRSLAAGVTAGLWADGDRNLTQRWAAELHGAGHVALRHGVQHDTGGRLRAVTLFDATGAHEPWGLDWDDPTTVTAATDETRAVLARRGIRVTDRTPTVPLSD